MPVSVHKMLIHESQVVNSLPLPVGQASEEGIEPRNKDIMNACLYHTCKTSRTMSNMDLVNWLLVMSDPVVASFRKLKHHMFSPLSSDVISMLKHVVCSIKEGYNDGDDSDDESEAHTVKP